MQAPHEKIRLAKLSELKEPARSIIASQFGATPQLEAQYYDHIASDPFYSEIYSRWVLDMSPLPPLPKEEELYLLREDVLGIRGIAEPKNIILNEHLFAFLLDICSPFLTRLAEQAMAYYSLPEKTDEEVASAMQRASYRALTICDAGHVQDHRYPDFITAFGDAFKALFAREIGFGCKSFSDDNPAFVKEIEKEWQRLLPYSDFLYGFEVVPEIKPEDMIRYLKLPFTSEPSRYLSKDKTYQQINNYMAALATFKPVPDTRVKTYFRQELCSLYLPLAEKIARREAKKKSQIFSREDIKKIVIGEISKAAGEFDYFYATIKNLKRGKTPPGTIVFPIDNSLLAKLGHISSNDEFPFTAYLERQLEKKIKIYFADDLKEGGISLDEEYFDEGDDGRSLSETISDDSSILDRSQHIPDYDALDKDGNKIGWKRDTFAGIIGKHQDTLKRWDKSGLLVSKRYEIYSPAYKKKVPYRAYTREDIPKAKEAEKIAAKRMRHQK